MLFDYEATEIWRRVNEAARTLDLVLQHLAVRCIGVDPSHTYCNPPPPSKALVLDVWLWDAPQVKIPKNFMGFRVRVNRVDPWPDKS